MAAKKKATKKRVKKEIKVKVTAKDTTGKTVDLGTAQLQMLDSGLATNVTNTLKISADAPEINNPPNFGFPQSLLKDPYVKQPTGHFEGQFWVWPNNKRTHVRHLFFAVKQMRPLPRGFYEEAKKSTLSAIAGLAHRAEQLKIPADVDVT